MLWHLSTSQNGIHEEIRSGMISGLMLPFYSESAIFSAFQGGKHYNSSLQNYYFASCALVSYLFLIQER
jgi:hypothetical protein